MDLDLRRGPCGLAFKAVKWLPVLFILAVVCWSYYVYIVQICVLTVLLDQGLAVMIILLLFYHFFLLLFLWSYWRIALTPAGRVPASFRLTPEEMDLIESSADPKSALEQLVVSKDVHVAMRSLQGEVRYCGECSQIKPDRSHHCSVCGECVLKMDHHCPWVNNCVAFGNYKFFILFLGYALLYCLFVALSTLKYFVQFWTVHNEARTYDRFHIIFLFFVSIMFSISISSLFGYHLFLVSKNRTTLEAFRAPFFRGADKPDKNGFHLGVFNNFQEVLGDHIFWWFVPVVSNLGDGVVFPQRGHISDDVEASHSTRRNILLNAASPRYSSALYQDPEVCGEELIPMINADDCSSSSSGSSSSSSGPLMQDGGSDADHWRSPTVTNSGQMNGFRAPARQNARSGGGVAPSTLVIGTSPAADSDLGLEL